MIKDRINSAIRNIPDFPKPGILFKDITPIFLDHKLCKDIVDAFDEKVIDKPDAVVSIESRGFLFGTLLAQKWEIPFIPIRKKGKLPGDTFAFSYDLEYGSATIEMHKGHLKEGMQVMVHDDLLATGGTAEAAAKLVQLENCNIHSFSFLIDLSFLNGNEKLKPFNADIISLAVY